MLSFTDASQIIEHQLLMFSKVGSKAIQLGKGGIMKLCKIMCNPQEEIRGVHIAGTNGKGSVATILYTWAVNNGQIAGLFTSPYLSNFRESIRIGGQMISKDLVRQFVTEYQKEICSGEYSQFEVLTAMAFWAFRETGCQLSIIETGLGGRDDSTNIFTPLLSIITNISREHINLLGPTLDDIRMHKAGIIKKGTPLLLGKMDADSRSIFREIAQEHDCQCWLSEDLVKVEKNGTGYRIWLQLSDLRFAGLEMSQLSNIGRENLTTAIAAIELLQNKMDCSDITVHQWLALLSASPSAIGLRGRWEKIRSKPTVILDGAHNNAAWLRVCSELANQRFEDLWIIIAHTKGKSISTFLKHLPQTPKLLVASTFPAERAQDPQMIVTCATTQNIESKVILDPNNALEYILKLAKPRDLILCTGSLYFIAQLIASNRKDR